MSGRYWVRVKDGMRLYHNWSCFINISLTAKTYLGMAWTGHTLLCLEEMLFNLFRDTLYIITEWTTCNNLSLKIVHREPQSHPGLFEIPKNPHHLIKTNNGKILVQKNPAQKTRIRDKEAPAAHSIIKEMLND